MKMKTILISMLFTLSTLCLKRSPEWLDDDFKKAQNNTEELTKKDIEEVLDMIETQKECNDKVIQEIEKKLKKDNHGK